MDPAPDRPSIAVIIPVCNEEQALPRVLADVPGDLVDEVIVVDNASTDRSAQVAREAGARVVAEPRRGYGSACLAGITAAQGHEVLVFMDGDYSDYPEDMRQLLAPVLRDQADLVIGSRMSDRRARNALTPQARFGNRLATLLMRLLFGIRCSDLGPFRVIRRETLLDLHMQDKNLGWTVEMQLRARLRGLRVVELPVRYRKRIGRSKISGTVGGTLRAGSKILTTILAYRIRPPRLNGS